MAICCSGKLILLGNMWQLMVAVKMNYSEITIGSWGKTVMINKLKLGVGSITLFLIQTMSWDIMHRFEGIVWETGEGKLHTVAYMGIPIGSMYGIYANIRGILMGSVTIYTSTMDPMGYCIRYFPKL